MERALTQYENTIRTSLLTGATSVDPQFHGMTLEEIETSFSRHRDELEKAVTMALMASLEAEIRTDYIERAKKKRKDPVSRDFRSLYKRRKERARLDEEILTIWIKQRPVSKVKIEQLKKALKLRHWIAHGRYWMPKLGRSYTPENVIEIAREISEMITHG